MRRSIRLCVPFLVFLLVPAPLFAQVSTSTAKQNSSSNAALSIGLAIGTIAGISLISGLTSSAATIPVTRLVSRSFGGRIIAVVPCVIGVAPALHVTIKPAGIFPVTYIWTIATITKLAGPPRNIGQQVLGTYDAPFVCFLPGPVHVPLYGLRMTMVGTSALF